MIHLRQCWRSRLGSLLFAVLALAVTIAPAATGACRIHHATAQPVNGHHAAGGHPAPHHPGQPDDAGRTCVLVHDCVASAAPAPALTVASDARPAERPLGSMLRPAWIVRSPEPPPPRG